MVDTIGTEHDYNRSIRTCAPYSTDNDVTFLPYNRLQRLDELFPESKLRTPISVT